MNPTERKVADAAISGGSATTIPNLQADIGAAIGMSGSEVKPIIEYLVAEDILKLCPTPTRNVAAGEPPRGVARVWYEKGQMWKDS